MPHLIVTYALSSKSMCSNCHKPIINKSVKFGYQSTKGRLDFIRFNWVHENCLTKHYMWGVKDLDEVDMEALNWNDQNRIRQKLKLFLDKAHKK